MTGERNEKSGLVKGWEREGKRCSGNRIGLAARRWLFSSKQLVFVLQVCVFVLRKTYIIEAICYSLHPGVAKRDSGFHL